MSLLNKKYPRIKEHLFRCKNGVFSKIYAISKKTKIYKSNINNRKIMNSSPKVYYVTKQARQNSIRFLNQNSGIEETYNFSEN